MSNSNLVSKRKKQSSDIFNAKHFKAFSHLSKHERQCAMNFISPVTLATACSLIIKKSHLNKIIDFMDEDDQNLILYLTDFIKITRPRTDIIINIQQVIMNVFNSSKSVSPTMLVLSEIIKDTCCETLDKEILNNDMFEDY